MLATRVAHRCCSGCCIPGPISPHRRLLTGLFGNGFLLTKRDIDCPTHNSGFRCRSGGSAVDAALAGRIAVRWRRRLRPIARRKEKSWRRRRGCRPQWTLRYLGSLDAWLLNLFQLGRAAELGFSWRAHSAGFESSWPPPAMRRRRLTAAATSRQIEPREDQRP